MKLTINTLLILIALLSTKGRAVGQTSFADYHRVLQKIEQRGNTIDLAPFATEHLKTAADQIHEHTVITTKLPKPNRKKQDAKQIYASTKDAVLTLGTYYLCGNCDRWHVNIQATAVVLSQSGICATNYHVMENLIGLHKNNADSGAWPDYVFAADQEGNTYAIKELLTYSKNGDLAIFQLETNGHALRYIPIGETAEVGSQVYALSHPHGARFMYYFSGGQVARNLVKSSEKPHSERTEITADYAVGSSGGPIIDHKGNLVALVSATEEVYADPVTKTGIQMIVKECIPINTVKTMLN